MENILYLIRLNSFLEWLFNEYRYNFDLTNVFDGLEDTEILTIVENGFNIRKYLLNNDIEIDEEIESQIEHFEL